MKKILLVGERCNIKISNIPFDRRMGCGKFLYESLLHLFEYVQDTSFKFYFNNVIVNGKINKTLKNKSKGKTVIALGNAADKVLTELKIKHKKLQHPAFFKRFRSKEGSKRYGYLLYKEIYGN
jgi:hypothetical protein